MCCTKQFVLVEVKDRCGVVVVGFTELRQMTGKRALLALLRGHREAATKRGKTMKYSSSISTLLTKYSQTTNEFIKPPFLTAFIKVHTTKAKGHIYLFSLRQHEATNIGLHGPFTHFTENWFDNFFDQFSALLLFEPCCFLRIHKQV